MSIEALRDYILNFEPPTYEHPVCFDQELRLRLRGLRARVASLSSKKRSGEPEGSMDGSGTVEAQIEELTAELEQVQAEAAPRSAVLVFRRLPATPEDGHTDYATIKMTR